MNKAVCIMFPPSEDGPLRGIMDHSVELHHRPGDPEVVIIDESSSLTLPPPDPYFSDMPKPRTIKDLGIEPFKYTSAWHAAREDRGDERKED